MKKSIVLMFPIFVLGACLHGPSSLTEHGYPLFDVGRFAGFAKSPTEHIIVETDGPLIVQEVRGVLHSAGGEWPQNVTVVFEIRASSAIAPVLSVIADRQGRFHLRSVPSGSYTFKATANGWQSVVGTIVVSKNAKLKEFALEMPLGV